MIKLSAINFRKYLLLAGIILIIIGIFLAPYDQFKTDIKYERVHFPSQNDNLTITANLYLPQNFNSSESYPAVVLVHGINDRAETFHHMAVEFVRRNFIALAIYLRGHESSEGICTLSAKEPWDIMGAADFLLLNYNISNLGLVGHSLGAMSSVRAVYNDTRFNATVVLGLPVSVDILISRFITDLNLMEQYLPYLSFHMNLSDPYERYIRSPVFWINQTRPKNFLYALGTLDTAATVEEALLCITNATGNTTVEANVAYGDFAAGNRTMLKTYLGINHGAEPTTPEIILDTVLWTEEALLGSTQGALTLTDLIQWNTNTWWSIFITIGFILCIFPGISYICSSILPRKVIDEPTIASNLNTKKKLISVGIYLGIFIIASTLTIPVMELLRYVDWSPYNIAGFVASLLTIQGCFLAIGFIGIFLIEKRYYHVTWIDFGLNKKTTLRAGVIGIVISAFLIFGFFFLPDLPNLIFYFPRDWGAYLLIFLNFLFITLISELYLRGSIQTKFFKETSRIRNWFNLFFIAFIGGLLQGVAMFFILLPISGLTISYEGFTLNIGLIALIGGIVIFTVIGLLNAWIYQKTKHILTAAIVEATLLSWFLISFMVML
ncbi:MAG TPA: alpha/beta hydrolase [Candidatus Deferrimicrobium sp.]|nr:alpha/beta hydrolase [Candidatus Deferrimicrobium sp.]